MTFRVPVQARLSSTKLGPPLSAGNSCHPIMHGRPSTRTNGDHWYRSAGSISGMAGTDPPGVAASLKSVFPPLQVACADGHGGSDERWPAGPPRKRRCISPSLQLRGSIPDEGLDREDVRGAEVAVEDQSHGVSPAEEDNVEPERHR